MISDQTTLCLVREALRKLSAIRSKVAEHTNIQVIYYNLYSYKQVINSCPTSHVSLSCNYDVAYISKRCTVRKGELYRVIYCMHLQAPRVHAFFYIE